MLIRKFHRAETGSNPNFWNGRKIFHQELMNVSKAVLEIRALRVFILDSEQSQFYVNIIVTSDFV